MSTERLGHSLAALNGKLYAVGGAGNAGVLKSAEAYDPGSNTWSPIANMSTERGYLGLAALNGKLYAVGGQLLAATAEAYDPGSNSWSPIASMPYTSPNFFSRAVALNGKLYAMGNNATDGFQGAVYDPTIDSWSLIASMPGGPYSSFGLAALNGEIYAVGGQQYGQYLKSTAVYKPDANTWSPLAAKLSTARQNLGLAALNGSLYAVGGTDLGVHGLDEVFSNAPVSPGACTGASAALPFDQCHAWQAFYDSTGGEGWAQDSAPFTPLNCSRNDPCEHCAYCDAGVITLIELDNSTLKGTLPPEMRALTDITRLDLQGNMGLAGTIPGTLTKLTALITLDTNLTGTLPANLDYGQIGGGICQLISWNNPGFACPLPAGVAGNCAKAMRNGSFVPMTAADCVPST